MRNRERDAYFEAHERYRGFHDVARQYTKDDFQRRLQNINPIWYGKSLFVLPINDDAIHEAETEWPKYYTGGDGNFPWSQIARRFRSTPRRFEVALWADDALLGLAAGWASKNDSHVAIHFLERRHGHNLLQGYVAPIAVACAEAYAHILGKRLLKIRNPTDGALRVYEALRFRLVRPKDVAPYCEREV